MKEVAIIDVGVGNIHSLERAVFKSGYIPSVVTDANAVNLNQLDGLILPGVGHAKAFLSAVEGGDMAELLLSFAKTERPLVGICLGMQVLGGELEEADGQCGLGILPFDVRMNTQAGLSCSHTCWESIDFLGVEGRAYFNHRYSCIARDRSDIEALSTLGDSRAIAYVKQGNVYGLQFHPEKSQKTGLAIIRKIIGE